MTRHGLPVAAPYTVGVIAVSIATGANAVGATELCMTVCMAACMAVLMAVCMAQPHAERPALLSLLLRRSESFGIGRGQLITRAEDVGRGQSQIEKPNTPEE